MKVNMDTFIMNAKFNPKMFGIKYREIAAEAVRRNQNPCEFCPANEMGCSRNFCYAWLKWFQTTWKKIRIEAKVIPDDGFENEYCQKCKCYLDHTEMFCPVCGERRKEDRK